MPELYPVKRKEEAQIALTRSRSSTDNAEIITTLRLRKKKRQRKAAAVLACNSLPIDVDQPIKFFGETFGIFTFPPPGGMYRHEWIA